MCSEVSGCLLVCQQRGAAVVRVLARETSPSRSLSRRLVSCHLAFPPDSCLYSFSELFDLSLVAFLDRAPRFGSTVVAVDPPSSPLSFFSKH